MNPFRLSSRVAASGVGAEPRTDTIGPPIAVPWRVVRRTPTGLIEVVNAGGVPLRAARFSLAGSGMLGLSLPRTVHPGERLRVVLRGVQVDSVLASADSMLILRWFQPDGTELLWPIAL